MHTSQVDEHLLDAGRAALRRFGYAGATVERIATEAGVSRVTLHRRGISKDLILATLADRAIDQYRAMLWPAVMGVGTGRDRLKLALRALCDAAEANLELLVALRAQADAIFHEQDDQPLTQSVFTEPLERLLRDGLADGTIRELDPVQTATVLFNLVGWTYVHMRTGHRWPRDRSRDAVVDLALQGVASPS